MQQTPKSGPAKTQLFITRALTVTLPGEHRLQTGWQAAVVDSVVFILSLLKISLFNLEMKSWQDVFHTHTCWRSAEAC